MGKMVIDEHRLRANLEAHLPGAHGGFIAKMLFGLREEAEVDVPAELAAARLDVEDAKRSERWAYERLSYLGDQCGLLRSERDQARDERDEARAELLRVKRAHGR